MLCPRLTRRPGSLRRTLLVLVAAATVLTAVSGASALIGGGTPPATFAVTLDGELVQTAKGYALDAAVTSNRREYTLRVSLALTDNTGPVQSFQNGDTFATATVELLDNTFQPVRAYTLAQATVVAYHQAGDAATNTFTQELVLRSRSLTVA